MHRTAKIFVRKPRKYILTIKFYKLIIDKGLQSVVNTASLLEEFSRSNVSGVDK